MPSDFDGAYEDEFQGSLMEIEPWFKHREPISLHAPA
jgi:hypothetical protein